MYDPDLAIEVLRQVHWACQVFLERFGPVRTVDDFAGTPGGMEKLDAICMQLIAIVESLKKIDTVTGGQLLSRYPGIDRKKAKGLGDILSHHSFDLNAEEVL